jgi:hypothetical protein
MFHSGSNLIFGCQTEEDCPAKWRGCMGHDIQQVCAAVQNVKEYLAALPGDHNLTNKASGPFSGGYKPKLDQSPELDPTRANLYQSQIGILRWCVELGRIDIITEVSMLSTYLCFPCEGHL